MDTQGLLALADRILAGESDPETLSLQIESYSAAFERWSSEKEMARRPREELETVLARHDAVLERAQALLGKTGHDLKTLRSRAKGVVQYLGQNLGQATRGKAKKS